jgi:hypothetical protein
MKFRKYIFLLFLLLSVTLVVYLLKSYKYIFISAQTSGPTIGAITVQTPGSIEKYAKFEISFPITTVATNLYYLYDANPPAGVERVNNKGNGITVDMLVLSTTQTDWSQAKNQACFWFQPYKEIGSYLVPTGAADWRCRLASETTGTWKYKIRATDASGTTETAENQFTVAANNSSDFRKKGFIRMSPTDKRFFEYSDGSAFFTPLINTESNSFNTLSGIRSNITQLAQGGIRFIRWFPTRETAVLYFYGDVISPAWGFSPCYTTIDEADTQNGKRFSIVPSNDSYMTQYIAAVAGAKYRITFRAHVISGTFRATVSFSGSNVGTFDVSANSGFNSYSFEITNTSNSSEVSVNLKDVNSSKKIMLSNVVFQRFESENNSWGPNLIHHGDADTYSYVDQVQAAKMDEIFRQSEINGVYHKLTLFHKNDEVLGRFQTDGSVGGIDMANFYDSPASRWYQNMYTRYFTARWSYSTALHSLEHVNETDPGSWQRAVQIADIVHAVSFRKVLVSNSYWHWGGPINPQAWTSPSIDYADRHYYTNTGSESGGPSAIYSNQANDTVQYGRDCNTFFKDYNQANSVNKPFVQGEGGNMGDYTAPPGDKYGNWYHKKVWVNTGALGYTCDGEWWPRLWDSHSTTQFPTDQIDMFKIYKAYSSYLANEPLSNGSHIEIGTDLTGSNQITNTSSNLRAFGSKDAITARVLVWVDNKNNTWKNNQAGASEQSGTFSISGMPNGSYTQEIWDTRAGTATTTANAITVANGTLAFTASTGKDIAYKFYIPGIITPSPNAPTPTTPVSITPVPTVPQGSTAISLSLLLHGIGNGGDNVNPSGGGTSNPAHPQHSVTAEVSNSANQVVLTQQGTVTYNTTAGNFTGTISLGTLVSGVYTIKITVPQYLKKTVPGIVTLTQGQTTAIPSLSLVTGDSNSDNLLSILDYNMLLDCYSDLSPAKNCTDTNKKLMTDLTDDGSVNQFDYNLFLRELSVQGGQ